MKGLLKIGFVYYIAYIILLMVVIGMICVYPKLELHLLLNSHHTAILDIFFKYYSMMAEGPLYALALFPLFWKKIKITVFFALCELSAGGFLQILKHLFSSERPLIAFERYPDMTFPVVEGVNLHAGNSFPSGHASTFFIFFTCCAILLALRYRQTAKQGRYSMFALLNISLLILAALGAFSRIYLSQHFLSDVCVGSIIGFVTPCLMFYFAGNKILKYRNS